MIVSTVRRVTQPTCDGTSRKLGNLLAKSEAARPYQHFPRASGLSIPLCFVVVFWPIRFSGTSRGVSLDVGRWPRAFLRGSSPHGSFAAEDHQYACLLCRCFHLLCRLSSARNVSARGGGRSALPCVHFALLFAPLAGEGLSVALTCEARRSSPR